MAKSIGELSVFVDESGSFDSSLDPSRFYIVTLLCHDQAEDIKPLADELESQLGYLGYPDTCIHAGPLLRREEDFRAVEIEMRRKLLPLNKSEEFFFGKWRDLKRTTLPPCVVLLCDPTLFAAGGRWNAPRAEAGRMTASAGSGLVVLPCPSLDGAAVL